MLDLRQPHRAGQSQFRGELRDARQMVWIGLVRGEHEPGARDLGHQVDECGEDDGFVTRPGGPRDDGERAGRCDGEARERIARAVEALRPLRHAVVARVPRDLESAAPRPQLLQAAAVFLADRADPVEGAVRWLRPAARGPAEPGARRRHGGGDETQLHATARRRQRQLGPHIELREHQGGGLERIEHRRHVVGAIEREIVRHVRRQRACQPLGRRGKERVGELPARRFGAQRLEHRLGLQAFAHRRGVHPHERTPGVALALGPGGQALGDAAARVQSTGELLVEACGQRQGPLRQADTESIHKGRARHQRPVLVR